jgi:hypothetical protein
MATSASISLSEYLSTSYKPDREYLNGELRERNVGKWAHARTQALLAAWFRVHEKAWDIMGGVAPRLQVSGIRVRVPDLVVMDAGPQPDVLVDPPFAGDRNTIARRQLFRHPGTRSELPSDERPNDLDHRLQDPHRPCLHGGRSGSRLHASKSATLHCSSSYLISSDK